MTAQTLRHDLRKWPKNEDGLSRYRHPGGFVIQKRKRDWTIRVYGVAEAAGPLYWWEVTKFGERPKRTYDFPTLREARDWCDQQPSRRAGAVKAEADSPEGSSVRLGAERSERK